MNSSLLRNKWALVSGASSGIGRATAEALAQLGCHLILLARRSEKLSEIQKELIQKYSVQVETHTLDVRNKKQIDQWAEQKTELISRVSVLVNNAGLASGVEKIQDAKTDDWDTMIDTNIKGLLYLTRLVLPQMIQKQEGFIVNLGSVAGRWTYPQGAVYCATKFAVRALTEGIRMDTLGTGIRVCNIEPGMVETEFSVVRLGDESKAKKVYENMQPLTAVDIAETIAWVVSRPQHINIQELVIYPTDQAHIGQVHRRS